jgi:O-antigen ligase
MVIQKKWARISVLSLLFLIIILSGTRGIWAASIGIILLATIMIFYAKRQVTTKSAIANFVVIKNITAYLIIFFVMFLAAFPIFSSPQFLLAKDNSDILKNRIRSIIDFGETSNNQRIEIWKKTIVSIKERPFLGVGIGNYPVVLDQDIRLAKAGSSAHNLYLHITAEMGLLSGIIFICFLWLLFQKNYENFIRENDKQLAIYFAATLLYIPWILIYSLTDIAIFDERALLFALIPITIILGNKTR